MKVSIAAALLGLASTAFAARAPEIRMPAVFKPPQVFKNANLVHIISLEKNYVKEQINVLIENVSKEPQDAYYLPFTKEQLSRVGGLEVKDRKDASAGLFDVDIVAYQPIEYVNLAIESLMSIDD
jgi:oligosaccharyltransferase complex subunit alpha (ribophorin I)